ncbi:PAS domain S-box-containing protein [Devosia sp. UYZn731]|uniref:PAS domain-containing protein n=1 Tax=Devosia sp. UYZn731 TaxID=3156345 RepID=UPI003399566B
MFRSNPLAGIDLAALFDAAPNPYVVLDLNLVIFGANEAYLKVVGRARDEITGRHVFDAFPSDPQSPPGRLLRESLAKVLQTQRPDHIALIPYNTARAGEPAQMRHWSATHTPIFDENGAMTFILQHTTDITELEALRQGDSVSTPDQSDLFARAAAVQAENTALSGQTARLRALFEQAPSFMALLSGPNHVFELTNAAYRKLIGHRHDVIGQSVAEALPEVVEQGFIGLLDQVYRTGEPFVGKGAKVLLQQAPDEPLEEAYLDFIYQPMRDAAGATIGIFVQGHDITEQKKAEADLARQGQFLRLAQEAGGIGTFEWDLATNLVSSSPAFRVLYGFAPDEDVPATRFAEIVHPDDRERLATSQQQSLEQGLKATEYRVITPTGTRWIGRQGTIIHGPDGKPERVLGAAYDLTERKEAETQMAMLAQESAHRIKNMLALVQAIATQTMRNSADLTEARDAIGARLVALGQAQDLLTHGSGSAAGIRDVVVAATRLHSETFGRVHIEGPNVLLEPKAVLGLGLMLHELGTNALKYGAFSVPEGRVEVRWTSDGKAIDWSWREIGGPPVVEPQRKGFGSRLIERGLSGNLGGDVMLDYAPDGLVCHARISIAKG